MGGIIDYAIISAINDGAVIYDLCNIYDKQALTQTHIDTDVCLIDRS